MAAAVQPQQQVADLMQNLKVGDQPTKTDALKKDATPFEPKSKSGGLPSRDPTVAKENKGMVDAVVERGFYSSPNNCYGFYFPGHEASGKWDDQSHFVGMDGLQGIHAENGSLVYYTPGYGYAQPPYNPYNPYIPGALIGADGQFLGHQHYYAAPTYRHAVSSGYFSPPVPPGSWVHGSMVANRANAANGFAPVTKPAERAVLKTTTYSNVPSSQSFRPISQIQLNQQQGSGVRGAVLAKDHIPFRKLGPDFNSGKVAMTFTNDGMNFKPTVYGWVDAYRIKGRGKFNTSPSNENWNLDGLNDQNRGPRTNRMRYHQIAPPILRNDGSHGMIEHSEVYAPTIIRDQYNRADFPTKYDAAKFFVIKSYSEDDVHKSIKYNVWASTADGNKRLDGAYQDAQERSGGKSGSCPVFLFFSVNASGQFCGVAEMIGCVDFDKSMDFWQQDKWSGVFPVKWHIIKDVPNSQFRQIILENNDKKPVTNSRDTQEVKYAQGIEMLNIFKSYSFETSILDDFAFYEGRQKAMQEKKLRQHAQFQQQVQPGAQAGPYVQKKNLEQQLCKTGEDIEVATCSDLSASEFSSPMASTNGSQVSDLSDVKDNSPERKEEIIQSAGVDQMETIQKDSTLKVQVL